jgi:hypothetical protein
MVLTSNFVVMHRIDVVNVSVGVMQCGFGKSRQRRVHFVVVKLEILTFQAPFI